MKVDRPKPMAASAIATSGAASSRKESAANSPARPAVTIAASGLERATASTPLVRMQAQTSRIIGSSIHSPLSMKRAMAKTARKLRSP